MKPLKFYNKNQQEKWLLIRKIISTTTEVLAEDDQIILTYFG